MNPPPHHDRAIGLAELAACDARAKRWPLVTGTLVALALGIALLAIDLRVARWMDSHSLPGLLSRTIQMSEVFAHGIGSGILLLAIWILDPARRWAQPKILVAVGLAGLSANLLKLLVARTRPRAFDLAATDPTLFDTFAGWLPGISGGSAIQSFPSAHAATAVGLAAALCWVYPRGRWLFSALALVACCQRVVSGAHFASDVVWGGALGWTVVVLFLKRRVRFGPIDRLEHRWAGRAVYPDYQTEFETNRSDIAKKAKTRPAHHAA